jgi:pilus assembly protein CpaF
VFGKRSDADTAPERKAPPPPPAGAPIATRPQSDQGSTASGTPATKREGADTASLAGGSTPREHTRAPKGLDQLRAAAQGPTAQIVREQSDYYHATKTTIFNALLNTIDLSQLAQLDLKSAAEEIKDIVAELVAIKNVSMSVAEQDHLIQDIINDVLGYGPLEPLLPPKHRHVRWNQSMQFTRGECVGGAGSAGSAGSSGSSALQMRLQ